MKVCSALNVTCMHADSLNGTLINEPPLLVHGGKIHNKGIDTLGENLFFPSIAATTNHM